MLGKVPNVIYHLLALCAYKFGWLVVFYVPSTARSLIPCPHLDRYRTGTNCSGTVWIGTEPRASIPVPERYRSTCSHYKLSGPIYTRIVSYGTRPTNYWVSDRNGTVQNERFIHRCGQVERYRSDTVPIQNL